MTIPDVILVVSGGNVQVVYAPSETRIQIIDFDNLKAGDTFDPHQFTPPDGPPNGADALEVVAEALALTTKTHGTAWPTAPRATTAMFRGPGDNARR